MSATSIRENTTTTAPPSAMGAQVMRVVAGLMGVVTLAALVIYTLAAFNWQSQTFLGVMVYPTGVVNTGQPVSSVNWTGLDAGLQHFDFITAVNGQPLVDTPADTPFAGQRLAEQVQALATGDSVTVTFERDPAEPMPNPDICTLNDARGVYVCNTTFSTMAFPSGDFVAYFIIPLIASIVAFGIGVTALVVRGQHFEGSLIALLAFCTAVYMSGIFDAGSSMALPALWLVVGILQGGISVALALRFPVRLKATFTTPALSYIPLIVAAALSVAVVYLYYNPIAVWDSTLMLTPTAIATVGLIAMMTILITLQRPLALSALTRHQVSMIIIGGFLTLIPATMWLILRFFADSAQVGLAINFESLVPVMLFPNMALLYSLLQIRRIDTDALVSQSITYALLLGSLITAIFLLTLGASLVTQSVFNADNPLVIAVILFIMVVFFTPVRNALQTRIDRVYFREQRDYQQRAEQFGQTLTPLTEARDIVGAFTRAVDDTLAPQAQFLFLIERDGSAFTAVAAEGRTTDIHFMPDSELVRKLSAENEPIILPPDRPLPHDLRTDHARLTVLKARVIYPLAGRAQLNGFIVIGTPRGERTMYNYEEIRFVGSLATRLAVAIERAQVINSLERRVRELDVLSQVGQAVNFTIGIDDLLELIYAQTIKLVDAPAFYITLYDENADQIYFAFFLEDDERYNDRENIRWELSNDLWSDIIRDGKSLRVSNYAQEVKKRLISDQLESERLRAWMGVPLLAGSRKLGVIAVGKLTAGEDYSDEQFKIFNDIGSLAATSLDKANLFNETRIRERQLTALNDISRQLVAAESNVEQLLELIMQSSVDILNSEAGSLFLTAEDNSNELEFSVVIGGGGADLVGKRIDVGSGIAGRVATTGQSLIVNDAARDNRRTQTMDEETNFTAQNLLAVPLIAKDTVIGVLEVMNKRDGTPFTQSDADLLNTFAGQAAVAIENARLLRMQDIQLADRVRELETLERIDRDLNRTLDLREVATITVRSAMKTLNANAGALGIVSQSPPYLHIVAKEGYGEGDAPAGADGDYWPLEGGTIGRVMRTRQADLITDTSIDPDYSGGLDGAISQMTIPMMSGDEINAILILEKNTEPRFSLTNWLFAQRVAEHASIAIANAQFYAALTEANKSKSEFMGFAAHELKTPLASVKGYAEVLLTGMTGELSDQQKSFINIIQSNAKRMDTLISDLRDSAKMDANEFRVDLAPIDIHNTIVETLRPLVNAIEDKNQTLINDVGENLPLIMGDETRLIQVFTNLMTNANKYSPENTTVTVSAEVQNNYINSRGVDIGRMMVIGVTDQGFGMSEEDVSRLFKERYFRSTNQSIQDQPGTGLGMMLTHGIIDKHGGDIKVKSALGEGSTFYVALPLAPAEEQEKARRHTEPASD